MFSLYTDLCGHNYLHFNTFKLIYLFIYFLIYWFLERDQFCCSTYLYIHQLILVCALTGNRTHNLVVLGRFYKQLSYLAGANTYPIVRDLKICTATLMRKKSFPSLGINWANPSKYIENTLLSFSEIFHTQELVWRRQ